LLTCAQVIAIDPRFLLVLLWRFVLLGYGSARCCCDVILTVGLTWSRQLSVMLVVIVFECFSIEMDA